MRRHHLFSFLLTAVLGVTSCGRVGEDRRNEGVATESALSHATPPEGSLSLTNFFEDLTRFARRRAASEYSRPPSPLPTALDDLTYDEYRAVAYRPDAAIWRGASRFELQLFHPGFLYPHPVQIHLIQDATISRLPFDPALFEYRAPAERLEEAVAELGSSPPAALGYAGFRIHYPLNSEASKDEVAVFLGASYFRLLGPGHVHGLSSRGIAVDVAEPTGEEFPDFTAFWLVRPEPDARSLTFFGLLEGPSVTGAYRFELEPGERTVLAVDARLFARQDIRKLGVAPLTSMFLYGPNRARGFDDYRPQVHDSDGLLMHTSRDQWIWRPLSNRSGVQVTSLRDIQPRGFGLVQRDRSFESYLDLEARYHRRPSEWVDIEGDWGRGGVELVELPGPSEFHDNIVSYWSPDDPFRAGEERSYRYRLITFDDRLEDQTLGYVERTRIGLAGLPEANRTQAEERRRFVIDFGGSTLATGSRLNRITPTLTASSGEISELILQPLPDGEGVRATFVLTPEERTPADLILFLEADGERITETWSYLWVPAVD